MELPHINVKNPARCHKVEIHDLESEGENVTRTKHLFVRSSLVLLSRSFFFSLSMSIVYGRQRAWLPMLPIATLPFAFVYSGSS